MIFEDLMKLDMNLDELMKITQPYRMAETIEELGIAKRIIDEYTRLHPNNFTKEDNEVITLTSIRLMRELDSLIQTKYGPHSFENEEDEDDPNVIYIPAGRKVGDPVKKHSIMG